jgi:uncharacterized protein (DUF488 family)
MAALAKRIYTIGHSTHTIEDFTALLKAYKIQCLADIRSYPGSRRLPQFNKPALSEALQQVNIAYQHMPLLGGKIPVEGGYTSYMQTDTFLSAIKLLEETALKQRTVYMCAEANWRNCHRSHISNYLKKNNWQVIHIKTATSSEEHPEVYTQGKLF